MKLTDIVPDLTLHGDCDLELARRVYLGEGVWGRLREGRNPAVWSKVSTPCALWTHQPDGKTHGYGKFNHKRRRRLAHREVYKLFVGPIPPGWDVDHMCGQAECVRPDHLEACSKAEHRRRHTGRNVYLRATEVGLVQIEENEGQRDYILLKLPPGPQGVPADPQYRRMPRFSTG